MPGEDEALGLLVAGQRLGRWPGDGRDRVADLGVADALEPGGDVADLAGDELLDRDELRPEDAQLERFGRPRRWPSAGSRRRRGACPRRAGRRRRRPCRRRSGCRRSGPGAASPGRPSGPGCARRSPRGSRATPVPSLAEARMTSSRGIARTFSSSSMIVSGSADGRSILLRTGMSVRFSRARGGRWRASGPRCPGWRRRRGSRPRRPGGCG